MQKFLRPSLFLTLAVGLFMLSGCFAPVRARNEISPAFNACLYKTYALTSPQDKTRTQWLADDKQRATLDDMVRGRMRQVGLAEVTPDQTPDLLVGYSLEVRDRPPTASSNDVIMASEYKLGTLIIDLIDTKKNVWVWRTRLQQVVGDSESTDVERARKALKKSFASFPACRASHQSLH